MYRTLSFRLETEEWMNHFLDKKMAVSCRVCNLLVADMLKKLKQREESEEYIKACELYKTQDKDSMKQARELFKKVDKDLGFSKYQFMSAIVKYRQYYGCWIGSTEAQALASRVWSVFERYLYKDGKKVRFFRRRDFNAIVNYNMKTGITFDGENITFSHRGAKRKGLSIPVRISNGYEREMIACNKVVTVTIKRNVCRRHKMYWAQLTFNCENPVYKYDSDGVVIDRVGEGNVNVTVGNDSVFIEDDNGYKTSITLAEGIEIATEKRKKLNRKMDSSRRSTNPENYNDDKTIKERKDQKPWKFSNRYKRLRNDYGETYRKECETRKIRHYELISKSMKHGNVYNLYVEDYKSSQMADGEIIANRSPATFVELFKSKVGIEGGTINIVKVGAA
mgnify:CR=1 FL=1